MVILQPVWSRGNGTTGLRARRRPAFNRRPRRAIVHSFAIAEAPARPFPIWITPANPLASWQTCLGGIPPNVLDYAKQMFLIPNNPVITLFFPKRAAAAQRRIDFSADKSLHTLQDIFQLKSAQRLHHGVDMIRHNCKTRRQTTLVLKVQQRSRHFSGKFGLAKHALSVALVHPRFRLTGDLASKFFPVFFASWLRMRSFPCLSPILQRTELFLRNRIRQPARHEVRSPILSPMRHTSIVHANRQIWMQPPKSRRRGQVESLDCHLNMLDDDCGAKCLAVRQAASRSPIHLQSTASEGRRTNQPSRPHCL